MSKVPPLPPCEVHRATWDSGWSQYHDESDPLPAVWDDTAPDEVQGFFSGDRLRARDRQIVELCAQAVLEAGPKEGPLRLVSEGFAAAIRALLDEKGNDHV